LRSKTFFTANKNETEKNSPAARLPRSNEEIRVTKFLAKSKIRENLMTDHKTIKGEYDEGESESEFPISYTILRPKQKLHRIVVLWRKAFVRAKMA
jgi:hypothetical protein